MNQYLIFCFIFIRVFELVFSKHAVKSTTVVHDMTAGWHVSRVERTNLHTGQAWKEFPVGRNR